MNSPAQHDAFLAGGGEMGALVRRLDWSSSPLGPPETWPQSLRTAVSLCLMSRFPMAVCWGPVHAIIYNDAYRPILGTKHPWAMGRPCFEVWSELAHIVQPMFDGVMATGEATWSDDLMLPMLRHGYLEEAYFTVSYSAIRGESGRPEGVLVTVTETTERYLAERRLQLVRALGDASGSARSLAQAAADAETILARHSADVPFSLLYLLDADAATARLVAATGVAPGATAAPTEVSLAGGAAPEWPLDRLRDASDRFVLDSLTGGPFPGGIWPEPATTAVVQAIPRPGQREPFAALVTGVNPRRALDPRHLEFFQLVARQIANAMGNALAHEESRRRAEALAEIDRAKTAFFSNVSHEFRTPLTLMLGPLQEVIDESRQLPSGDRERLEVAHRNALRLLKLVNALLDFSRIEAGRMQASYEPTDLPHFTADLASGFRSAIERAGVRFIVNCSPASEPVFVDREMWEKVVLNLLSNALKFTFEGEIEVSTRQRDRMFEMTVRDTGTGIPAAELPHVFERFHRVRNARSRSFEGTGIGLALVQELVALHGGSVRVESVVDRGSTFIVAVPLGASHLAADRIGAPPRAAASAVVSSAAYREEALRWLPGSAAPGPPAAAIRQPRLVVADDNADMLDYLRRLLVDRYDVVAVRDGAQALEAIRQHPPDLVLSDVMMPGLDGFALLGALRSDPATRKVPVVLLSARAGEEARLEGLRAGADDYLVKPFSAAELVARVASTLQLSRLHQEGEERLARVNRQLRRQVAEQETLLDVLPVGIGIAHDRDSRDIRINRAFAAMLRLPPDANASKTAPESERPTNFRVLTPDGEEVPGDQLPLQIAAREGREVKGVELDIVHDDGQVVRLLEYAAPLFDELGSPAGAVGAFIDVSASHQAKQRLTRSEERHRRIFETAGVSIWEADFTAVRRALDELRRQGVEDLAAYFDAHPEFVEHSIGLVRVIDVNRASLDMFGAPDKSAVIRSFDRVLTAETRRAFAAVLVALARGDRRFEAETALQTLDGRSVHALMTITFPAHLESFDSVLVSLADITDRKRMENALRRRETLFREMADTAPVMLWITDADGQCTFLSRSWYEFTGQTAATGLGLGWTLAVHPDDREATAAVFLTANQVHEPFRLEYRLRRVDGTYRWAIDSARPRVDENGSFAGYIGAVIDISERKDAETALQQEVGIRTTLSQVGASLASELNVEKLVDAITRAAITLTAAERGTFVDHGRDAALGGQGVIRLDDITREARASAADVRALPEGEAPVRSYLAVPVIARDGHVLGSLVFGHSRPGVFSAQHEQLAVGVAAWASIALDNARLYRDVEEANRVKDEFLATLSHELRTPLNAVLGWAHMLRQGAMPAAMQQRALESLERNAKAQAQLVEDLLDVSRIMSGKLHINAEEVDLVTTIENAVDTVRPAASAKRLDLQVQIEDRDRLLVTGDEDRLQQIVWNLVSNAIKFTPSGGAIHVGLRSVDSRAEIAVRDTGQGIAPAFRPHLFERFRQMDASIARRHGGLGLGLSIVRHLTEAHGGTVSAESAGEGQGSTFRVLLPLRALKAANQVAARDGDDELLRVLSGVRVLVVDDEPDAREMIRYLLESRGARVMTALSAGEALHFVGEHDFDVIIADIGMPEQDGYALIRAVRALPGPIRGLPAIAVTAYAGVPERDKAMEAGYNWHLSKPVDPEMLVATVASAMSARNV